MAVLHAWAAAGAVSAAQVPRGRRRWILAGVGGALAFRQLASDHLSWIRHEADCNPQWWNRAWRNQLQ